MLNQRNINSHIVHIISLIFILALGTACQPPTLDNPRAENIYVQTVDDISVPGDIEPFPLPNCGGTGELSQTLGTLASVTKSVTIGGKATARGGAEAAIPETVKLQLELEVEAAYQQAYETANARLDTIEMKAAPKTHVVYGVQWERREFSSFVTYEMDREIFDTPYTYVLNVPKISNSEQTVCYTVDATSTPTSILPDNESVAPDQGTTSDQPIEPETETIEETPHPTIMPIPEPIPIIIPVWAFEENGVRVSANTSGVYQVEYTGDAYSPWPNEQAEDYRGWTTIVRIYINRSVEWGTTEYGLSGPINHDDYLSPGGYYLDKNQAINTSVGDKRTFRLNAGDFLTLTTLDEKGRYGDNQGKVDVSITYIGQ